MWAMIVTVLFYGNAALGHFSPAVTSVQFSSKSSCEAGRSAYNKEFKQVADDLNAAIATQRQVGEIKGPSGVVFSAVCVQH